MPQLVYLYILELLVIFTSDYICFNFPLQFLLACILALALAAPAAEPEPKPKPGGFFTTYSAPLTYSHYTYSHLPLAYSSSYGYAPTYYKSYGYPHAYPTYYV